MNRYYRPLFSSHGSPLEGGNKIHVFDVVEGTTLCGGPRTTKPTTLGGIIDDLVKWLGTDADDEVCKSCKKRGIAKET